METLGEYRKKAKISQSVMAEMLGTTPSQIAMAERGERKLPKKARKLYEVMQSLPDDPAALYTTELPLHEHVPADEALRTWQEKAEKNKWEIYRLRTNLAKMKAAYTSLTAQHIAFQKMMIAIRETGGKKIEVDFFKGKQTALTKKMLACGPVVQLRLKLSIDLLVGEANLINQYSAAATAGHVVHTDITEEAFTIHNSIYKILRKRPARKANL